MASNLLASFTQRAKDDGACKLVSLWRKDLSLKLLMSSYGKRTASSPRETMSKKGSGQNFETDQETLVKIELETLNSKPFFGQVSDDELIYIWVEVFKCKLEDLFGVTSTKTLTRNVRATYKLKKPIKIHEVVQDGPTFGYEKFLDDGASETITGRIIGYGASKPAEIGDLIKVSVKTNFGVEANGVLNWLRLYGTVSTSNHDFAVANARTGLKSDIFIAEIVLKRHIEEFLPMYGQKAIVSYPGIPKQCNRCYVVGHLRRDCQNTKKEWVHYISDLLDEGQVKREYIGSWISAISKWKNARSNPPIAESAKE